VSSPGPPEDEIQWILNEVGKYLSDDLRVRRSDVLSAWQGFRPLASDPHALPGASISRDHLISTHPKSGITFVTGGKWTTYREMAQDVVSHVCRLKNLSPPLQCSTLKYKLIGGVGYKDNLSIKLIQKYGISEFVATHLSKAYGTRAHEVCRLLKPSGKRWPVFGTLLVEGYPYIEEEVEFAILEYARTVSDVLTLRTRLAFLNAAAAAQACPRVAEIMAEKLGWSAEEKEAQVSEAFALLSAFGGPIPDKRGAQLTAATVRDLLILFGKLDIDKSGYISASELFTAAEALGFPFPSQKDADEAFSHMMNGEVGAQVGFVVSMLKT
jgi:glycerol-3-phosphate dehydrogenase